MSSSKFATQSAPGPIAIALGAPPGRELAQLLVRHRVDLDDGVRGAVHDPERLEPVGDVGEARQHGARRREQPCLEADAPRLPGPWIDAPELAVLAHEPDRAAAERHARARRPAGRVVVESGVGAAASFWSGLIRASWASAPSATHTAPPPTVTSLGKSPTGIVRCRSRVAGSIRATVSSSTFATQTAPSPTAIGPGSMPTGTSATSSFDAGSITPTELGETDASRRRSRA